MMQMILSYLMKKTVMLLIFGLSYLHGKAQKNDYNSYPVYNGNDLGLTYSPNNLLFGSGRQPPIRPNCTLIQRWNRRIIHANHSHEKS